MTYHVVVAADPVSHVPAVFPALDAIQAAVHVVRQLDSPEARTQLRNADGLILMPQSIPPDFLEWTPRARVITFASTGYDGINLAEAAARGIWVTHVPGYCTEEVATFTLTLLLALASGLVRQAALTRTGVWSPDPVRPLRRLSGQTLGLLGFGRIGRAVAQRARGFGLRLIAHDPLLDAATITANGALPVDFETLLRESDFLSLHTYLTESNTQVLNAHTLALLKPTACVINTARGALIDEAALLAALDSGRLAGAALDVLSVEPPDPQHPLLHHPRVIVTPHSAWCSEEAEAELWTRATDDVARVLRGEPPQWPANRVAPPA
jgi:D-3-phosphoglycerate dehydrogenase